MDPALLQFFELVCDRIDAHPTYAALIAKAVEADERLILNYHTHGPDEAYCVSVCIAVRALPQLQPSLEELAHIRGVGTTREECGPRMAAFAACLAGRHALAQAPDLFLDGVPFSIP